MRASDQRTFEYEQLYADERLQFLWIWMINISVHITDMYSTTFSVWITCANLMNTNTKETIILHNTNNEHIYIMFNYIFIYSSSTLVTNFDWCSSYQGLGRGRPLIFARLIAAGLSTLPYFLRILKLRKQQLKQKLMVLAWYGKDGKTNGRDKGRKGEIDEEMFKPQIVRASAACGYKEETCYNLHLWTQECSKIHRIAVAVAASYRRPS